MNERRTLPPTLCCRPAKRVGAAAAPMAEWVKVQDGIFSYYWNKSTGETAWKLPEAAAAAPASPAAAGAKPAMAALHPWTPAAPTAAATALSLGVAARTLGVSSSSVPAAAAASFKQAISPGGDDGGGSGAGAGSKGGESKAPERGDAKAKAREDDDASYSASEYSYYEGGGGKGFDRSYSGSKGASPPNGCGSALLPARLGGGAESGGDGMRWRRRRTYKPLVRTPLDDSDESYYSSDLGDPETPRTTPRTRGAQPAVGSSPAGPSAPAFGSVELQRTELAFHEAGRRRQRLDFEQEQRQEQRQQQVRQLQQQDAAAANTEREMAMLHAEIRRDTQRAQPPQQKPPQPQPSLTLTARSQRGVS